jgi:NAD(P)-dependent dehydrogenase (short-subunit alcohol dehydrogenase family)
MDYHHANDLNKTPVEKAMNNTSIERKNEPAPTHDLTGKRVVVVGGKTGIGLGVALAAQAAGAAVVVASRRHVSAEERPDLASVEQVSLDLHDEASVRAAFETIGSFDHLHVTAGDAAGSWGAFMDEDMRGVRNYMESKFLGSWACARHAFPHLAKNGSITLLTGGTAARAKLGLAAVTSVFSAVEALSGSLALELAPVRVNTIRPGFVETEWWNFLSDAQREEIRAKVRAKFPSRRLGTPADIGHAALFLMTNPYVTGTVLEVGGGELLVDWIF